MYTKQVWTGSQRLPINYKIDRTQKFDFVLPKLTKGFHSYQNDNQIVRIISTLDRF